MSFNIKLSICLFLSLPILASEPSKLESKQAVAQAAATGESHAVSAASKKWFFEAGTKSGKKFQEINMVYERGIHITRPIENGDYKQAWSYCCQILSKIDENAARFFKAVPSEEIAKAYTVFAQMDEEELSAVQSPEERLLDALRNDSVFDVKAIIETGVNVNARFKADSILRFGHDTTPLMVAALRGNFDAVIRLLKNGADLEAKNKDNNRAIDFASSINIRSYLADCRKTHEFKARCKTVSGLKDLVAATEHLEYAIHLAVATGDDFTLSKLVEGARNKKGYDIMKFLSEYRAPGAGGQDTLLTMAATYGHTQVCRYLLKCGLDQSIKNNNGDDAKTIAARYDYNEVIDLLDEAKIANESFKNLMGDEKSSGSKSAKGNQKIEAVKSAAKKKKKKKKSEARKAVASPLARSSTPTPEQLAAQQVLQKKAEEKAAAEKLRQEEYDKGLALFKADLDAQRDREQEEASERALMQKQEEQDQAHMRERKAADEKAKLEAAQQKELQEKIKAEKDKSSVGNPVASLATSRPDNRTQIAQQLAPTPLSTANVAQSAEQLALEKERARRNAAIEARKRQKQMVQAISSQQFFKPDLSQTKSAEQLMAESQEKAQRSIREIAERANHEQQVQAPSPAITPAAQIQQRPDLAPQFVAPAPRQSPEQFIIESQERIEKAKKENALLQEQYKRAQWQEKQRIRRSESRSAARSRSRNSTQSLSPVNVGTRPTSAPQMTYSLGGSPTPRAAHSSPLSLPSSTATVAPGFVPRSMLVPVETYQQRQEREYNRQKQLREQEARARERLLFGEVDAAPAPAAGSAFTRANTNAPVYTGMGIRNTGSVAQGAGIPRGFQSSVAGIDYQRMAQGIQEASEQQANEKAEKERLRKAEKERITTELELQGADANMTDVLAGIVSDLDL